MSSPTKRAKSGPWDFLTDFKAPLAWLPKIAPVVPIVAEYCGIGPPMESKAIPAIFIAVGFLFIFGLSYTFWSGYSVTAVSRTIYTSIIAFGLAAIVYAVIFQNYVVVFDDDPQRQYVVGFQLHDHIGQMRQADPSQYTDESILNKAGRKPGAAWTKLSLGVNQFLYLIAWTILWVSLFAFVGGCIAVYQHKSHP